MSHPSDHRDFTRVFLRDYAAQIRVGVYPHEQHEAQTVIINVECEAAVAHRFDDLAETSLDRAIDYMRVQQYIATEIAAGPHISLLESVAELIASFCLRDQRIAVVRVRLEKPNLLPGLAGAGIEIQRVRKPA